MKTDKPRPVKKSWVKLVVIEIKKSVILGAQPSRTDDVGKLKKS